MDVWHQPVFLPSDYPLIPYQLHRRPPEQVVRLSAIITQEAQGLESRWVNLETLR